MWSRFSVISTSGRQLVDGSGVRVPLRGWYRGTEQNRDPKRNMEGNGAIPDIIVHLLPNQNTTEEDAQLEAAVEELLRQLEVVD